MSSDEGLAHDGEPLDTLSATVTLPFPGLEQATLALRGQLRAARDEQALPEDLVRVMDWDTLTVDGPTVEVDSRGCSWFVYTAQILTRALRPVD